MRLAHTQRGGVPTLEDRFTASRMGAKAVECLLDGQSNIVVCKRGYDIVTYDINYAQTIDRMYKNKLTDAEIAALAPDVRKEMEAFCDMRRKQIHELYNLVSEIAR